MAGERGTDQAGDAVAKRYEVQIEAIGVAIEDGAEVLDRCALLAGHDARGSHEMPNIGIVRTELQGLGVELGGFRMPAEAR